jgi:hypothetical protein
LLIEKRALSSAKIIEILKNTASGNQFLHWAVIHDLDQPVLKRILQAYPSSRFEANKANERPIDISLRLGRSPSTLSLLLEKDFKSINKLSEDYPQHKFLFELMKPSSSAKLLNLHLCGDGAVGKTTLRRSLEKAMGRGMRDAFTSLFTSEEPVVVKRPDDMTIGLEMSEVNYAGYRIVVHDYGGQRHFHVNHSRFLNAENSIFVIVLSVWDFEQERLAKKAKDYDASKGHSINEDEIMRQYDYWLRFINSVNVADHKPKIITLVNGSSRLRDFIKQNKRRDLKSLLTTSIFDAVQTKWTKKGESVKEKDSCLVGMDEFSFVHRGAILVNSSLPSSVTKKFLPVFDQACSAHADVEASYIHTYISIALEVKDQLLKGLKATLDERGKYMTDLANDLRKHPGYDEARHQPLIDSLVDSSIDRLKDRTASSSMLAQACSTHGHIEVSIIQAYINIALETEDQFVKKSRKIVIELPKYNECIANRLRKHSGYDATRHESLINSLVDSSIDRLKDMKEVLLVKSWIVLDPNWMTSKVLGTIAKKQAGLHEGLREWDRDKINELADDAASLFFGGDTSSLPMILQDVGAVIPVHRSTAAASASSNPVAAADATSANALDVAAAVIAEGWDATTSDVDASTIAVAGIATDVAADSSNADAMKYWFPVFLDDREAVDVEDVFQLREFPRYARKICIRYELPDPTLFLFPEGYLSSLAVVMSEIIRKRQLNIDRIAISKSSLFFAAENTANSTKCQIKVTRRPDESSFDVVVVTWTSDPDHADLSIARSIMEALREMILEGSDHLCCMLLKEVFIHPETGEIDSEYRVVNGLKLPVTAEHDQRFTRAAVTELDPRYATAEELHGVSGQAKYAIAIAEDASGRFVDLEADFKILKGFVLAELKAFEEKYANEVDALKELWKDSSPRPNTTFHHHFLSNMENVYMAVGSIVSGFVKSNQTGHVGMLGRLFQAASSHVPMGFGIVVYLCGKILEKVDDEMMNEYMTNFNQSFPTITDFLAAMKEVCDVLVYERKDELDFEKLNKERLWYERMMMFMGLANDFVDYQASSDDVTAAAVCTLITTASTSLVMSSASQSASALDDGQVNSSHELNEDHAKKLSLIVINKLFKGELSKSRETTKRLSRTVKVARILDFIYDEFGKPDDALQQQSDEFFDIVVEKASSFHPPSMKSKFKVNDMNKLKKHHAVESLRGDLIPLLQTQVVMRMYRSEAHRSKLIDSIVEDFCCQRFTRPKYMKLKKSEAAIFVYAAGRADSLYVHKWFKKHRNYFLSQARSMIIRCAQQLEE